MLKWSEVNLIFFLLFDLASISWARLTALSAVLNSFTVDDRRQKRKKKKRHPSAVPTILAKEICDPDFFLYPCLGRASSTHCWIRLMSHAKAGRTDEALNKRNR